MTDRHQEGLSALLDGEIHDGDVDSLLDRLSRDGDQKATLARYSLIGHALRGEPVHRQALDIHQAVSRRLQDEPAILAAPAKADVVTHPRWWRPAAGLAIAASVAALAVVLVPQVVQQDPATPAFEQVAQAPTLPAAQTVSVRQQTRWTHGQPEIESKLNAYLADHNEFAGQGSVSGLIPYASFVSYDGKR